MIGYIYNFGRVTLSSHPQGAFVAAINWGDSAAFTFWFFLAIQLLVLEPMHEADMFLDD